MNRIDRVLATAKQTSRKLLSPYITAGDPLPAWTVPVMHELVAAGADIIELGIPFSEPMAEGVVIQQAMARALNHGVRIQDVLAMVSDFRRRDQDTPVVLMSYLNPIETMGYAAFAGQAAEAGVDGVIVVDLPPEEAQELTDVLAVQALYPVFLCSPTTSAQRLALINDYARGYVYHVSLKGVTGASGLDLGALQQTLARIGDIIERPILVGFGIKTAADAQAVSRLAAGVVVGAAVIEQLQRQSDQAQALQGVNQYISGLRQAIDNNQNNDKRGEL
jgi:tryptophan synthase alpha chain